MAASKNISVAEPVFLRQRDVKNIVNSVNIKLILCNAMEKVIPNAVRGVQSVGGLWYLYPRDTTSRITLLVKGLSVSGLHLQPMDKDPFLNGPNVETERILFRNLPMKTPNSAIREFLMTQKQVHLTSDIFYDKIKDQYNIPTQYYNGDRYIFAVDNIKPPLPESAVIGGVQCKIWHRSQSVFCQRCKMRDHNTSDVDKCSSYIEHQNVVAFKSPAHPFSNFHRCGIKLDGQIYPSAEHAYQFLKLTYLGKLDMAESVMNAHKAADAKRCAAQISREESAMWDEVKVEAMSRIIKAKAESYPDFKKLLIESDGFVIAEATSDCFWGVGMTPKLAFNCAPDSFLGRNTLGQILMSVRDSIIATSNKEQPLSSNDVSDENSNSATSNIMDTHNPATVPSDDTVSDAAASNSDTTIKNDNRDDVDETNESVHKDQRDIVLKHVEVNFVPHITKEQAANRRRVKPMVKQNTAPEPGPASPSSPTVNGISVFDISTNTEVSTDGSMIRSPDPLRDSDGDTQGSAGASTGVM